MDSTCRRRTTVTCVLALTLLLVGGLFFPGGVRAFAEGLAQDVATSASEPSDAEKDQEPVTEEAPAAVDEAAEPMVVAEDDLEAADDADDTADDEDEAAALAAMAAMGADATMLLDAPSTLASGQYELTDKDGLVSFGERWKHTQGRGLDNIADGITINLFDYWGDAPASWGPDYTGHLDRIDTNSTEGNPVNAGINSNNGQLRPFQFYAWGSEYQTINSFTGMSPAIANQGIVERTLLNGYPVLNSAAQKRDGSSFFPYGSSRQSRSLAYLFDPSLNVNGRTTYANCNYLLQKNVGGFYYYDSKQNYAEINRNNNEFTLWSGTFYKNGNPNYSIGFFPFDPYWQTDDKVGPVSNGTAHKNHQFGMTMSADFCMPHNANGKVQGFDGVYRDMVFNFSGDDDVWVFVDGVLVLDIGGIHQPTGGSINFTTGQISLTGNPANAKGTHNNIGQYSTLAQVFQAAGKTWDNSPLSAHHIDFFYVERGGNDSNCKLELNLPIVKTFDLEVQKNWIGGNAAHNGDPIAVQVYMVDGDTTTPYGSPVTLNNANDWKYVFEKLPATDDVGNLLKYYVREGTISNGVFTPADAVTASSGLVYTPSIVYGPTGATDMIVPDPSNPSDSTATITNTPNIPTFDLAVTKEWTDGAASHTGDSVKVQLFQGDTPYGDPVDLNAGSNWSHTFTGLPVCDAAGNAYTYYVKEVAADGTVITTITAANGRDYLNSGTTYGPAGSTTTTENGYTPSISNPVNGTVTLTNEPLAKLTVNKVWTDGNQNHTDADAILVQLYRNGQPFGDRITLNASNGWTHEFTGLLVRDDGGNAYTYTVKEVRADGSVVTTLTGANGASYTVSDTTYEVAGSEGTSTGGFSTTVTTPADGTATITNVAPSVSVTIKKVDATTKLALNGTTFELWRDENDGTSLDAADTKVGEAVTTGNDGLATFSNLTAGTYWLKETKAHAGYQVLTDPIRVEYDGTHVYFYASRTEATVTDNSVTVTIENSKVEDLPIAGSSSKALLAGFGTFLLFGATSVALTRKRGDERL